MTAYAKCDTKIKGGVAAWEIRSVNHRYLELSFRLPDACRHLENILRETARLRLSRGKVECSLKLDWDDNLARTINIDDSLVDALISACAKVDKRLQTQSSISALDILRWPMVVRTHTEDLNTLEEPLEKAFDLALQDLIAVRAREGQKLKAFIQDRFSKMQQCIDEIQQRLPSIQKEFRAKFQTKLAELQVQIDQGRFEQEMVYLMQKGDISEELDRLKTHLTEVERVIKSDKVIGRRLDFLMQELNREANTIASKATDNATIQDAVELKVLIEEAREQIQNLE